MSYYDGVKKRKTKKRKVTEPDGESSEEEKQHIKNILSSDILPSHVEPLVDPHVELPHVEELHWHDEVIMKRILRRIGREGATNIIMLANGTLHGSPEALKIVAEMVDKHFFNSPINHEEEQAAKNIGNELSYHLDLCNIRGKSLEQDIKHPVEEINRLINTFDAKGLPKESLPQNLPGRGGSLEDPPKSSSSLRDSLKDQPASLSGAPLKDSPEDSSGDSSGDSPEDSSGDSSGDSPENSLADLLDTEALDQAFDDALSTLFTVPVAEQSPQELVMTFIKLALFSMQVINQSRDLYKSKSVVKVAIVGYQMYRIANKHGLSNWIQDNGGLFGLCTKVCDRIRQLTGQLSGNSAVPWLSNIHAAILFVTLTVFVVSCVYCLCKK